MKRDEIVYVWLRRSGNPTVKGNEEFRRGIIPLNSVEMVTIVGRLVYVRQRGDHVLTLEGPSAREFLVAYTNQSPIEIDEQFASILPISQKPVEMDSVCGFYE